MHTAQSTYLPRTYGGVATHRLGSAGKLSALTSLLRAAMLAKRTARGLTALVTKVRPSTCRRIRWHRSRVGRYARWLRRLLVRAWCTTARHAGHRAFHLNGWGAYTWVSAYFVIISFVLAASNFFPLATICAHSFSNFTAISGRLK